MENSLERKDVIPEEMFETVYDLDGNPLSEEEMRERDIEDYIMLLREHIKRMNYLHEDDRRALSYLTRALLRRFQESRIYKKKKVKHGKRACK